MINLPAICLWFQVTMVLLILQSGTKVDTEDIFILSFGVPVTLICFALGYLSVGRSFLSNYCILDFFCNSIVQKMSFQHTVNAEFFGVKNGYFPAFSMEQKWLQSIVIFINEQVRWENKKLGIAYAASLILAPAYIIYKVYQVKTIYTCNMFLITFCPAFIVWLSNNSLHLLLRCIQGKKYIQNFC